MEDELEKFPVLRFNKEDRSNEELAVAKEFLFTIFVNDQELATLLCSPGNLRYLAVGFLASEGLLQSKDAIKKMEIDDWLGTAHIEIEGFDKDEKFFTKRLIASGCGGAATFYSAADVATLKVESAMKISPDEVFALAKEFQHSSQLYLATHGVHSAALADRSEIILFSEDIGRHNAVDKIFGKCLLEDIPTDDRIIISSGRISSEITHKVAKRGVPIIVSISAPTSLGLKTADKLGITLIGSVRGQKMNVYTHPQRVV
ncbi:MAG: formate dehydrogenase accessory sulfurtransferase FdhD [Dehalococcoidia bacterium]|jgi:FdhD protein